MELTGPCILYHSPYWYANDERIKSYAAEKFPNAKFVEEIVCCKSKAGNWMEFPGVVFYDENPQPPYKNKFFAIQRSVNVNAGLDAEGNPSYQTHIVGLPDFDPVINAIFVPNKATGGASIAISRYEHDFYKMPHADAAIDGGRDYLRTMGNPLPTVVPYNMLTRTFSINNKTFSVQPQIW